MILHSHCRTQGGGHPSHVQLLTQLCPKARGRPHRSAHGLHRDPQKTQELRPTKRLTWTENSTKTNCTIYIPELPVLDAYMKGGAEVSWQAETKKNIIIIHKDSSWQNHQVSS